MLATIPSRLSLKSTVRNTRNLARSRSVSSFKGRGPRQTVRFLLLHCQCVVSLRFPCSCCLHTHGLSGRPAFKWSPLHFDQCHPITRLRVLCPSGPREPVCFRRRPRAQFWLVAFHVERREADHAIVQGMTAGFDMGVNPSSLHNPFPASGSPTISSDETLSDGTITTAARSNGAGTPSRPPISLALS
jgi:hypothetical protein